jgi:hypothetical protein
VLVAVVEVLITQPTILVAGEVL